MDRRNFLKYMAVTPAAASASKILAGIPEAEPKISLLKAPDIITAQQGTMESPFVFYHIIYMNIDSSNNIQPGMGTTNLQLSFPMGRIHTSVSAKVYVEGPDGNPIVSDDLPSKQKYAPLGTEDNHNGFLFRLDIDPIRDWIFVLNRYSYEVNLREFLTAELQGFRVHPSP